MSELQSEEQERSVLRRGGLAILASAMWGAPAFGKGFGAALFLSDLGEPLTRHAKWIL